MAKKKSVKSSKNLKAKAKPKAKEKVIAKPKTATPVLPPKPVEVAAVPKKPTKAKKLTTKLSVKSTKESKAEKANQLSQKWSTLFRKSQEMEARPYNMRGVYEPKTPIQHKVLGWGYILNNKNDRLEVLFQDGIRYLISNYKS